MASALPHANHMLIRPNYCLERELWGGGVRIVAGVDEVGVGALAGPVVAAAVVLAPDAIIEGLADSKLLTPKASRGAFHPDQGSRGCHCHRASRG